MKYYCKEPKCNNKVSKKDNRCNQCMGKIYSVERKEKGNPNYKGGITLKKRYCISCNKNEISYENWKYSISKCNSCSHTTYDNILTKKFLIQEYIKNNKPALQIAKKIKCSRTPIYRRLRLYNIPIRTKSEAKKGIPRFCKPSHGKGEYYRGIWMRSSWEVKYAKYLDKNKITWQYEPKTFDLGNCAYTPDFYLFETNKYIENQRLVEKERANKIWFI